jgi:hypothetical protein
MNSPNCRCSENKYGEKTGQCQFCTTIGITCRLCSEDKLTCICDENGPPITKFCSCGDPVEHRLSDYCEKQCGKLFEDRVRKGLQ